MISLLDRLNTNNGLNHNIRFGHVAGKSLEKLSAQHSGLAKALLELSPQYKEIPKSPLPHAQNVPMPIRDVFSKSLQSISPAELKDYTRLGLVGLLEEIADVTHGTTLLLSRKTSIFNEANCQQFNQDAEKVLIEEPTHFAKKIWALSKQFVNALPWKNSKAFSEFVQINGLSPNQDRNQDETSVASKQLRAFLRSDFIDGFIRIRNSFPGAQGKTRAYSPQENVAREMAELHERIENFIKNPSNAAKSKQVSRAFADLESVFGTYCANVNPQTARRVYTSLANLTKALFGLNRFTVTELFEFMLQKQLHGRGGGIYLDKIHYLNGKTGYNQGKAIIKPVEYINEAAKVKELLARSASESVK